MDVVEKKIVKIYVTIFEASIDCWRPTTALDLGEGLYKILPTPDYDPEDEEWEFLPETIVQGEWVDYQPAGKTVKERILVAREAVQTASS